MAIQAYTGPRLRPDLQASLSDLSAYSVKTKAILTAMGDYWTMYYKDLEPVLHAVTGSVAALSRGYSEMLDMVLASNVLDVPTTSGNQFDLLVICEEDFLPVYDQDGNLEYYRVDVPDITTCEYLTTSLFESRVVLERGEEPLEGSCTPEELVLRRKHYTLIPDEGFRFYVDLFHDEAITDSAYSIDGPLGAKILLWASEYALHSTVIYNRFGRFLYRKAYDSEKYKWFVTALVRFYVHAKTNTNVRDILDIVYGIPYTRMNSETITEIFYVDDHLQRIPADEAPYICITTDKNVYYTYAFSTVTAQTGDTLPQFTLLAKFHDVEDYLSKPGWWEKTGIPREFLDEEVDMPWELQMELMDKILKHNIVYIGMKITHETYATYKAQVEQMKDVLKSGLPVYLYPFVELIFRAVFFDTYPPIEDVSHAIQAYMKLETQYTFGTHHYDGTYNYAGKSGILHDSEVDPFSITEIDFRTITEYDWDSPFLIHTTNPLYDAEYMANGVVCFGPSTVKREQEIFHIWTSIKPFSDTVPLPTEVFPDLTMGFQEIVDAMPKELFTGDIPYDGSCLFDIGGMHTEFSGGLRLHLSDTYVKDLHRTGIQPLYDATYTANGAVRFGPSDVQIKEDSFYFTCMLAPFSEQVTVTEDFTFRVQHRN